VSERRLHQRLLADVVDARRAFGGLVLPRIPHSSRTPVRRHLEGLYRSDAIRRLRGGAFDLVDRLRGRRDPSVPPRWLQAVIGGGDYKAIGDAFRSYFIELGGLRPEDDVLDIGCGSGRMAYALTGWLTGTYSGFDVVPAAIEWSRREITTRDPRFRFELADIRSTRYNPRGAYDPAAYRFPYADGSFDFVIAPSVFTHLRRPAAESHLAELARVLRAGGRRS
jgi:SAM-dependent methyltransferase